MASEVNANFIALANAVDEGKSFTTESIEKFNKELETRLDESLDSKLETDLSNSGNITNCLIELPERKALEISNGRIILKAGSEIIIPDGFEADGITPKFRYETVATDKSFYWASGNVSSCSLFINSSGELAGCTTTDCVSGSTVSCHTAGVLWYDSSNNIVKYTNNSGVSWTGGNSLPVCCGSIKLNSGFDQILQVFNGIGFIGQHTWVDKGVRCLFADGRNPDGTLKNFDVTNKKIMLIDLAGQSSQLGQLKYHNNAINLFGYGVTNYFEQETKPANFGQYAIWYNTRENIVCDTSDSGQTWNKCYNIVIPQLQKSLATASISAIKMPYAFKAADINDVLKRISAIPAVKSGNGYTRLPNGIIIQWGALGAVTVNATRVMNFSTAFTAAPKVCITINGMWAYCPVMTCTSVTTTNFTVYLSSNENKTSGCGAFWIAVGY